MQLSRVLLVSRAGRFRHRRTSPAQYKPAPARNRGISAFRTTPGPERSGEFPRPHAPWQASHAAALARLAPLNPVEAELHMSSTTEATVRTCYGGAAGFGGTGQRFAEGLIAMS